MYKIYIKSEFESYSFLQEITRDLTKKINQTIENYFIEGLKRKGFEFKDRQQLENFVKLNCRCEDNVLCKKRTYFVNKIAFLVHNYESNIDIKTENNSTELTVNSGTYLYL